MVDCQELASSGYTVGFSLAEYVQVRLGLVKLALATPVTYHWVPLCGQPISRRLPLLPLPYLGFLGLWETHLVVLWLRSGNGVNIGYPLSTPQAKSPP